MRYFRVLLILFLLAGFALPNTADAQLGRLKKKLKEAVGETAEEKAGEAAEDAVEAVLSSGDQEAERQMEVLNLGPNATSPANAPLIQYRSTTSINIPGMKTLSRLAGQDLSNISETVTQDATRMHTDQGDTGSITDIAGERMIFLNNKTQKYQVKTFAEMMQEADAALQSGDAQTGESASGDEAAPEYSFSVDVIPTGKSMAVNGSPSDNVQLIVKTVFEASGTDDQGEAQTMRGTFYALVDMWITDELAGYQTMQTFNENLAQAMGRHLEQTSFGNALGALGQDPRLGATMQKAAEEMKKMDGVAVRSTMYFVLAPEDAELDVELAMTPQKGGLAQMAQNMSATSGNAEIQSQTTLLSATTQISDLTTNANAASLDIPAGYTEAQ